MYNRTSYLYIEIKFFPIGFVGINIDVIKDKKKNRNGKLKIQEKKKDVFLLSVSEFFSYFFLYCLQVFL
jgi:hypothetical protein